MTCLAPRYDYRTTSKSYSFPNQAATTTTPGLRMLFRITSCYENCWDDAIFSMPLTVNKPLHNRALRILSDTVP